MTAREKAKELYDKHYAVSRVSMVAKMAAMITVENEYNSLREQLFDLRSYRFIVSERGYIARICQLIEGEKEVKNELEKL